MVAAVLGWHICWARGATWLISSYASLVINNNTMDKQQKFIVILVCVGALAFVVIFAFAIQTFTSGFGAEADEMFGDQHLKTSVALIELHKVRNGKYPRSLEDLEYIGLWDQGALQSIVYHTNDDQSAYYVEVKRGWIGKPDLDIPDGFWKGTGYNQELKPSN